MSLTLTLLADILVAILLVATIATSIRLSRRMAGLKADEAAMKGTIGELLAASATAERAVAGLREALADRERSLTEQLRAAEQHSRRLTDQLAAGETVLRRVADIAGSSRGGRAETAASSPEPAPPVEAAQKQAGSPALRAAVLAARDVAERAGRRSAMRAA